MFYIIFYFIMACFGQGQSNNNRNNSGQVTTLDDDTKDTSGETGTIPPRKP